MYASIWVARLLILADGYALVESKPFPWIGGSKFIDEEDGDPANFGHIKSVSKVHLKFPQGDVTVGEGKTARFTLRLRKKQPRILRFLDKKNRPVAGLKFVELGIYLTSENHMGSPEYTKIKGNFQTDSDGRLEIPDGDFEYLISLYWGDEGRILEKGSDDYDNWIGYLPDPETTFHLTESKIPDNE